MRRGYDAVVLMGPPGAGKSFLGRRLAAEGVASYVELEPVLVREFGTGAALQARIKEVGAFVRRSYAEQLARATLPVALESTGVSDRPLLDALALEHRVAMAWLRVDRALCIERVLARPGGRNVSHSEDPARIGRFYDLWLEKIAPSYRFDLELDGADAHAATDTLRDFFARAAGPA